MLAATPGVRIGSRINLPQQAQANVYVGAGVIFQNGNNFEVDARFATAASGTGKFRSTFNNGNIVGRFTAGIDIETTNRITVGLQYQGRHSAHQTEHGGQFRAAYRF